MGASIHAAWTDSLESVHTALDASLADDGAVVLRRQRKHKDTIDAVVVYALTRFSRNSTDHYAIGAYLRGLGIASRSVTEPIDDSPQAGSWKPSSPP